ncbi:JmjC domain-containing protein [Pseudomonas nunensis]|uniref:JmjC domain-containing protein n=1 Tax=Pseudomonas nunensis TaxID=2961896 RepID=UPI0006B3FC06|nr:cupin domain-containing protein [Pseudomonas nunensis]KOX98592.1 cupin [Pseudomonas nunensis]
MSISLNMSFSEFFEQYQEKKPLLIKGAASNTRFSWEDVNNIFDNSDAASNDFKLSLDGIRPKSEYVENYLDIGVLRHRLIKPVIYENLKNGATLIANKIKNSKKVNEISNQIATFTGRQVVSSAYLSFGSKDSFRCHWDTRDVFAIQLIGRKRWIVYEPSLKSPLYTQQSKDYEHLYPCPHSPYMDIVLEAGDVLYLPRGWWHNPLPLEEATFHLAIGTFPAYTVDYLSWLFKRFEVFNGVRRSLHNWQQDKDSLSSVGQHVNELITDPNNYHCFLDEFTGATRVDSSLALDIFGNPNAGKLPDHYGVRLCTNSCHGLNDGYIIVNGTRLNLDKQSQKLIRHIGKFPDTSIGTLLINFPETPTNQVRKLINQLCHLDILELSRA